MTKLWLWNLFVSVLLLSNVTYSAPITLQPSDFVLQGNSYRYNNTDEVILTDDAYNQRGWINLKKAVCAKHYVFSFDVLAGNRPASVGGGSGVFWYEIAASPEISLPVSHSGHLGGQWLQTFGINIQDRAFPSSYFNSIETMIFNDQTYGNGVTTHAMASFPLTGVWWKVVIVKNLDTLTATMASDLNTVAVSQKRTFVPGMPVTFQLLAWTGGARNIHAVQNIQVEILEEDDCSTYPEIPVLNPTPTPTPTPIDCSSEAKVAYDKGVTETTAELQPQITSLENQVAASQSEINILQSDNSALEGQNTQLKSQVASLQAQLPIEKEKGFAEGVASIDVNTIKTEAYQNGFAAGVNSIDTEGLKRDAYQEGFDAGKSSVQCENESGKITICHISGKKRQTIQISKRALKSHLNHGDTLGECVNAKSLKK